MHRAPTSAAFFRITFVTLSAWQGHRSREACSLSVAVGLRDLLGGLVPPPWALAYDGEANSCVNQTPEGDEREHEWAGKSEWGLASSSVRQQQQWQRQQRRRRQRRRQRWQAAAGGSDGGGGSPVSVGPTMTCSLKGILAATSFFAKRWLTNSLVSSTCRWGATHKEGRGCAKQGGGRCVHTAARVRTRGAVAAHNEQHPRRRQDLPQSIPRCHRAAGRRPPRGAPSGAGDSG